MPTNASMLSRGTTGIWIAIAAVSFWTLQPDVVLAQAGGGTSAAVVSGYGTVGYGATLDGEFANDFNASFSPIFLFEAGSDLLFQAELEFGLSGAETETTLEYAQIDYLGFERTVVSAGKFLLPFGLFGERYHPSWINKLPTAPLIYGHSHGGAAEGALIPVLSDAGVLVRLNQAISERSFLDLNVWVSQGPRALGEGGDEHADEADDHDAPEALDIDNVGFGVSFSDNNRNKMLGARAGIVGGTAEVYLSGFTSKYDSEGELSYRAAAISVVARPGDFEIQGEGAITQQEFGHEGERGRITTPAFYLQASRRFNRTEPVVRWSSHLEGQVDGESAASGHDELSLGLIYWMANTVPVKIAYQLDPDRADRIFVQWAFGF